MVNQIRGTIIKKRIRIHRFSWGSSPAQTGVRALEASAQPGSGNSWEAVTATDGVHLLTFFAQLLHSFLCGTLHQEAGAWNKHQKSTLK